VDAIASSHFRVSCCLWKTLASWSSGHCRWMGAGEARGMGEMENAK